MNVQDEIDVDLDAFFSGKVQPSSPESCPNRTNELSAKPVSTNQTKKSGEIDGENTIDRDVDSFFDNLADSDDDDNGQVE